MTKKYTSLVVLILVVLNVQGQFDKYFENKTLRMDYVHAGNSSQESYYFDELLTEPFWGGSKKQLIDTLRYGQYFFEVVDLPGNKVIYSRGYSTLFGEWQTTGEAKATSKAFSETVVMPYPKNDIRIDLFSRNRKGVFEKKFEYLVDIDSYFINTERKLQYPVFDVMIIGDPAEKIDIVILPEGYTNDEMGLFISDCDKFAGHLFDFEPYTSNRDKFNVRGILAPSTESGSDVPADGKWHNTVLGTNFYTFDSERYCMTADNKSVRNLAANAPYDQIYILVNTKKYGGGAIYNHYSITVNSNWQAANIFIHEFGHGFAGLGDEYYDSEVAYSDFYPLDVEPWEPNLTTLVNFNLKWENMLDEDTPVPTPASDPYIHKTGVFEGGGYAAKGVYRPAYDCMMNSFKDKHFCKVCKRAIQKMIDFYSE